MSLEQIVKLGLNYNEIPEDLKSQISQSLYERFLQRAKILESWTYTETV